MDEKLRSMRTGVALIVTIAAIAAVVASMSGTAVASHRAPRVVLQNAASPSWSPDGKQIVFSYVRYASTSCCGIQPSRFRIVRTSSGPGGAVHSVQAGKTSVPAFPMAWAAGGRILFDDGDGGGLRSVSVSAGKPQPIRFPSGEGADEGFILSPSRKIAAVTLGDSDPHVPHGIALVDLTPGREPAAVATPLTAEEQGYTSVWDEILGFSPDSQQLVFSRAPFDAWEGITGPRVLLAIRLDGSDPVPLAQSGIPGATLIPSDAQQVQWSPDGRRVAFVEDQTLEVAPTTGGGAPRVLAPVVGWSPLDSHAFSWSPTSNLIAYQGWSDQGIPQLMTVQPDGTQSRNLLKASRLAYVRAVWGASWPQWSPDGSRLVFLAHRFGHRTVRVWTIRANGRGLTQQG